MHALQFWKAVTMDRSDFLERILALLAENGIRYCLVGGAAANAYAEPLVSLDLTIAVVLDDIPRAERLLAGKFRVRRFSHNLNVSAPGSRLRVHIQLDPLYAACVERAQRREVLGLALPVAAFEDVLQAKIRAAKDPSRRRVKRLKDLVDIARLEETQSPRLPPQ